MWHKRIFFLTVLAFSALIIASCNESEYKSQIKAALGVKYVLWPPSTSFSPFTVVRYNKLENYTTTCFQDWTTGLSKEQIDSLFKEDEIADQSIKKEAIIESKVSLSRDELGDIDAKFSDIKKIRLELKNGKEFTLKWPVAATTDSINKRVTCKNEILEYYQKDRSLRFYLLTTLYGYDLEYSFQNEKGVDLSAGISEKMKQLVIAKLAAKYGLSMSHEIKGKKVFVAFKGIEKNVIKNANGHDHIVKSWGEDNPMDMDISTKREFEPGVLIDINKLMKK
jgi:hypothetical protein